MAGKDAAGTGENARGQQETTQDVGTGNAKNAELRSPGLVRFNIPENPVLKQEMQVRAKMAQGTRKRLSRRFTRGKLKDGEIVKVEKMLVRLDITTGSEQPNDDYDEKDSQRVETRITEKWREFMVVCRESHEDDAVLCLQMYKTRVSMKASISKFGTNSPRSFPPQTRARPRNVSNIKSCWTLRSSKSTSTAVWTKL